MESSGDKEAIKPLFKVPVQEWNHDFDMIPQEILQNIVRNTEEKMRRLSISSTDENLKTFGCNSKLKKFILSYLK